MIKKEAASRTMRIIARLDIKGPNVIKGIHFEGLRVLGRPELFAYNYYAQGVDELIYIDSVASLYGRNSLTEVVNRAAEKIYIPLTVGGGVKSIDDVYMLLQAGADKVAINTAAIRNPKLIFEAVNAFGSQCIVISIQARYCGPGEDDYECLTDNAREKTGVNVIDWVKKAADFGAGEILLTSVDRDGTGIGYDINLVKKITQMVSIPVIACGGAGKIQDIIDVIIQSQADAVCAASIFHYALLNEMIQVEYPEEGNTDFLKKRFPILYHGRTNITPTNIWEVKRCLKAAGINCRIDRHSTDKIVTCQNE